jgi:ketosteroid isomerase-like protein
MSPESIDVALAFIAAYNAGDIDTAVDLCDGEVDAVPDASLFPESRPLVGRVELRGFLAETWSSWANTRYVTKEVFEIGDGRVLIRGEWGGTGIASGVETYQDLSSIFTTRDGQISRAEWFFDHDKALRVAGLAD